MGDTPDDKPKNLDVGAAIPDMPEVMPTADSMAAKALDVQQDNIPDAPQKRGRGRPKGSKTKKDGETGSYIGAAPGAAEKTPETRDLIGEQRRATAMFCVGLVETSGALIGGPEMRMGAQENAVHVSAWDRWLEAQNINDLPPGLMLCIVTGQYYMRAFSAPPAKPLREKLSHKIKTLYHFMMGKRRYAQPDRGDDGQRKDNTGKASDTGI